MVKGFSALNFLVYIPLLFVPCSNYAMDLMLSKVFVCCLCVYFVATKQIPNVEVLDKASLNFQAGDTNAVYSFRQNKPMLSSPFFKLVKKIPKPWSRIISLPLPNTALTTARTPMPEPILAETPPSTAAPVPDPARTATPSLAEPTSSTPDSTVDSTTASINASSQELTVVQTLASTTAPFPKHPCNGTILDASVSGTCDESCSSPLVEAGRCTSSGSTGVCCVSIATNCGQTTSERISHFVNPGFPNPYIVQSAFTFATPCAFKVVRSSPDVCLARIEYRSVKLDGHPPVCSNDILLISEVVTGGLRLPHVTCGTHTDVNAIAEFTHTNSIIMVILPGQRVNADRVWNIRVTQIPNSCTSSGT